MIPFMAILAAEFEGKAANDRLDPTDATRVATLHTSETLGYDARLATLDVYVNWNDLFQPGQWNFAGNHSYAHTLYTQLLQGNSFTQSSGILLNLNTLVNAGFTGQNDATTKNNQSVVALNLLGTANNDTQAGGAANDTIRGNAGNDYITGGDGNDSLFGDSGNDLLYGGRGNDLGIVVTIFSMVDVVMILSLVVLGAIACLEMKVTMY